MKDESGESSASGYVNKMSSHKKKVTSSQLAGINMSKLTLESVLIKTKKPL